MKIIPNVVSGMEFGKWQYGVISQQWWEIFTILTLINISDVFKPDIFKLSLPLSLSLSRPEQKIIISCFNHYYLFSEFFIQSFAYTKLISSFFFTSPPKNQGEKLFPLLNSKWLSRWSLQWSDIDLQLLKIYLTR